MATCGRPISCGGLVSPIGDRRMPYSLDRSGATRSPEHHHDRATAHPTIPRPQRGPLLLLHRRPPAGARKLSRICRGCPVAVRPPRRGNPRPQAQPPPAWQPRHRAPRQAPPHPAQVPARARSARSPSLMRPQPPAYPLPARPSSAQPAAHAPQRSTPHKTTSRHRAHPHRLAHMRRHSNRHRSPHLSRRLADQGAECVWRWRAFSSR